MVVGCNYDCYVSSHEFGGTTCGLSINGCSLQPDNWRLLTCNRRLRFISQLSGCDGHVFPEQPLSLRSFGLESPAISFLSKFLMPSEP